MFGLEVKEKHDGYLGWRAIYNGRHIDILQDRRSMHGDEASVDRVVEWLNKKPNLSKGTRRSKHKPEHMSPWGLMAYQVPMALSTSDDTDWEFRAGNFVLRANPQRSFGYLYIAAFELTRADGDGGPIPGAHVTGHHTEDEVADNEYEEE